MSTAGFACPSCGGKDLDVANTRMDPDMTSRRRRMTCKACLHRFSTIEVPAEFAAGEAILSSLRKQVLRSVSDEELLMIVRERMRAQ